ncbi:transcriptional regulator domain-containing protein [Hyphomicrobium sp. 2TAF46]|uniref:transcriptional regulator domain-containing protein n=1 Tax=Hyphomicrobium sp. 2TAF46 TaxID=3233019 RepID=UPI003F8FC2A6
MPGKGQWRNESAYDYIDDLDPAALAWEFLRRNRDYRKEYARVMRGSGIDAAAASGLAEHWGLRFCPESRDGRAAWRDPLEPLGGPRDDPPATVPVPARKSDHH